MDRMEQMSILIVDDMEEIAEMCEAVLGDQLGHRVECTHNPASAPRLIKNRLFDVVIIDAKMTYKRAAKGGLILAEEVAAILGIDAVIIMSQYDVRTEVLELSPEFTFLPKPRGDESFRDWVQNKLLARIRQLFRRQFGFVVMPYGDTQVDALYENTLVPWMNEAGFTIKRMDEMPGPRAINTELQDRIRQSHFVIVYASDKNANVYYEAGFAAALDKFSIVFAPGTDALPFDLRSNFVLVMGSDDQENEKRALLQLVGRLRGIL